MRRAVLQAKEKGASSWFTVIPLQEHGFALNKAEFREALSIRYNKQLKGIPSTCPCEQKFDLNHAMNCKRGGFVIMNHNNVRGFEADLLKTMHNDTEIVPALQEIRNEKIPGNMNDEARPDKRARGVWRSGQNAYFDICLTNVNANYQKHQTVKNILKKHEKEKKRACNNQIMYVEHGTFHPLVFSLSGGEGPETSMFHKHIVQKYSEKNEEKHEKALSLIRCKLSF